MRITSMSENVGADLFGQTEAPVDDTFLARIAHIADEISLPKNFRIVIGHDDEHTPGRFFFQIKCWREDAIKPGVWDWGQGGKAYLSPHATDSELVQTVFGLYKAYWEHEARETFQWRGRRIFGPHISAEALWEAAPHVDVRSAKHLTDREGIKEDPAPRSHDVMPISVHPDPLIEYDLSSGGV